MPFPHLVTPEIRKRLQLPLAVGAMRTPPKMADVGVDVGAGVDVDVDVGVDVVLTAATKQESCLEEGLEVLPD